MRSQQKRRPENGGSDREVVIQMARGGVLHRKKISCRICSSHAEARVGPEPILLEIEIVLDEQRTTERVVPHSVAAHPWIDERQRKDEKKNQDFVVAREPGQSALSLNESQFCTASAASMAASLRETPNQHRCMSNHQEVMIS